ncbi:AraC family transcriptional regulator N-terminal domain-containing protein [Niveispirillum sp. KHB5.9]|uniref:AraC family transcriptional regulator n=1 Tax=Niveispirillum sp. KHB5.9 TaxID=3400269 RepID=UPI003A87ED88
MQDMMETMRRRVLRHAGAPATQTPIARLSLSVLTRPGSGVATIFTPVTCLILQGCKRVTVGETTLEYDSARYFVASLDLPAMGQILEASPDRPYVAVGLTLDRSILADLIASLPPGLIGQEPVMADQPCFGTGPVTVDLLEAWGRLLALMDQPEDVPALAAAREREILYRLLRGPSGGHLCQIAQADSRLARIRHAIEWIGSHFEEPLPTSMLAGIAGMSVASFHRHFRAATAMSPLQYQKTMRLHMARRLLASGMEAGNAAYSVGYESPSQFSREYSRAFGAPPSRDAERLVAP